MKMARYSFTLIVVAAMLLSFVSSPASAGVEIPVKNQQYFVPINSSLDKIEPALAQVLSKKASPDESASDPAARADFFVWLVDQADLSPAARLGTKGEKGKFVYNTLRSHASRSQAPILSYLEQGGIAFQSFYIANMILVRQGDLTLATTLAARPDVARIVGNNVIQLPRSILNSMGIDNPADIEPNITFINADDAWDLGFTGQGTVLAAIDTGLKWDHPAIIDHYRGWDGATANHNFNWWDATGQYPLAPNDGNGHGTMVTGVMVGGETAENQIGVAPGAKTIHCKAFDDNGSGTDETIVECFEWILAPWDLSGGNANPDLSPDALNNSWGSQSGTPIFEFYIDVIMSAGILVEASAGGSGPACGSLGSPGDYAQVMTTGAVDQSGGVLPGTLAVFSARGPSVHDPLAYIPDVIAPGVNVRSSFPPNIYEVWSGTAVAGAHVTGLVGLIWSANLALRGNITDTYQIIYDSAVPLTGQGGSNCGGDYIAGPNNDWGYGTIDALAAVQLALTEANTGVLSGSVKDAQTEIALEGADVRAMGFQEWITTTNSLGLFSMSIPSGTYTVSAELAGYYPEVITNVNVISGEITTQNFLLMGLPGVVSGTVTDAQTHAPLEGAAIQAVGEHGLFTTVTGVTGTYSLTVPGGIYELSAELAGYYPEMVGNLEVFNGGAITQDFGLLHLPVTISGIVTDANTGMPMGAEIQTAGEVVTTTQADPETGVYTLTLPAHSTYTLTAQAPGYGRVIQVVAVQAGDVEQDFVLLAGRLSVIPLSLDLQLVSGHELTIPITLTNSGGLSLTFSLNPTATWLSVSVQSGDLPASEMVVLELQINSAGLLAPGVYPALLIIATDTPYGSISIPVTLTVVLPFLHVMYLPVVVTP